MLTFAWPWAFVLVLLPLIAGRLVPRARPGYGEALHYPLLGTLEAAAKLARPARRGWRLWAASLGWLCLVVAAARPQSVGAPYALPVTGRDFMLAIDLSGSMQTRDYRLKGSAVTRLDGVRYMMKRLVARRAGDRVGLIVFGTRPYVHTPLTFDRGVVVGQLDDALIGMAGLRTAIGDAIGLAAKRVEEGPGRRSVLILVSDGSSTAGETDPLDAATVAHAKGLVIYTIGVGSVLTPEQERLLGPIARGRSLDEPVLRAIAEKTGGRYFPGSDLEALEAIGRRIDELEPVARPGDMVRPILEFYPWPLVCAAGFALLVLLGEGMGHRLVLVARGARTRVFGWTGSSS